MARPALRVAHVVVSQNIAWVACVFRVAFTVCSKIVARIAAYAISSAAFSAYAICAGAAFGMAKVVIAKDIAGVA